MMAAYFIIEFTATYFESFMCYYFGYIFSSINDKKKINYVMPAILSILVLCLNRIELFSAYTMLLAVLFVCLTEFIFLNIKFIEAISISSFFVVVLTAFDGFTVALLSIILKNTAFIYYIISKYSFYRIVFILISKALFFLCFYIIKNRMIKSYMNMKNAQKILISAMGITGIISLLKFTFEASDLQVFFIWGLFLCIMIISIYAIYWFACYKEEMLNISKYRLDQYMIEKKYDILLQDYKNNAQNFHDLKNHMIVIYKLLNNKHLDEAEEYVKQFINVDNSINSTWTGDEILDYILNIKKKKAEESNIEFTIDADYIIKLGISDKVMCSIFTNLLDNAIEACNKISSNVRFINVVIRKIHSFILIKVTNSINCEPVIKNKIIVSTKKGINHGLGFDSIVSSVQSNNGVISYNFNKERFEVNITFFES